MRCEELSDRLEAWLAGDLSMSRLSTASTRAHVAGCDRCRSAWILVGAVGESPTMEDGGDLDADSLDHVLERARDRLRAAFARAGRPVVRFDWLRTPVGRVFVGITDEGVCDVTFDVATEEAFRRRLADRAPEVIRDRSAVESALGQLDDYFSRRREGFSLPLDLRGVTPFTARVLEAIRSIPFGRVRRYGEVACDIGSPAASRAVGGALGRNPVPIIVPCHRVVARGGLGGFTGGLDTKRALLAHEGHATAGGPGLPL